MISHAIFDGLPVNDKEIVVYLDVLAHPNSSARSIEKSTGIGRTYVYDIAKKLVEKGFLTHVEKKKTRVFNAVAPQTILADHKKKLARFEEGMNALTALRGRRTERPRVMYYEGKEELDALQEHFISAKISKEAIAFSDDAFYVKNAGYHQKREIAKRLKQGVFFRAIAGMSDAVLASQRKDKAEHRETRILPKSIFDLKVQLGVHGHRTLVFNDTKNYAFVVEDQDLADTIKQIFEIVWNSGRIIDER